MEKSEFVNFTNPLFCLFPHLEEVKEADERRLADVFLAVPEEEPARDAGVQQLGALLGQSRQVEALLPAVPAAEKRLVRFVNPRRPWRKMFQMLSPKDTDGVWSREGNNQLVIIN